MAIHAITGVMGSGKSFELVSERLVKVLRDQEGRRFVTNVSGLNFEEIAKFCGRDLEYVKQHLITVSYERVAKPKFWYDPESGVTDTVVQPGDEVGLDEVWRYFNRSEKLPADAMRFFRMHRHYVAEQTGYTCDVVLVNQSFRGIHSDIRDVIEVQFQCRKLKALGRPQSYQVSVIEGGERKASHSYIRNYDKKVFPLYSSYDSKSAKAQETVDKRQSIFSKGFFKFVIPGFLIASIFAGYNVYSFLKSGGQKQQNAVASAETSASGASAASSAGTGATTPVAVAQGAKNPWRLVAVYKVGTEAIFVVSDEAGNYRTLAGVPFEVAGMGEIYPRVPENKAELATPWSGVNPRQTQKGS